MKAAKTVAEYMKSVSQPHRAALEKLRKDILAAAPFLEETISYGMPTFKNGPGYGIVSFAAFKNHCSLFPMNGTLGAELGGAWLAGKGTLQFTPDNPLPTALVKKIVKARLAEDAAMKAERAAKKATKKVAKKAPAKKKK